MRKKLILFIYQITCEDYLFYFSANKPRKKCKKIETMAVNAEDIWYFLINSVLNIFKRKCKRGTKEKKTVVCENDASFSFLFELIWRMPNTTLSSLNLLFIPVFSNTHKEADVLMNEITKNGKKRTKKKSVLML